MHVKETDLHENVPKRLRELLAYVNHLGRLNEKPVFMVAEYKQLYLWEHQLKGRIGIQHDLTEEDGSAIWLRIDRLKRFAPPPVPERIQEWLTVGNDPEVNPLVKETVIKTLPEKEAKKLLENGVVNEEEVREPLKQIQPEIKLKDIILRLKNLPEIKEQIDTYLNEHWLLWSEEEKPRRKTIKIYDSLFSLQQTIESHGDEQPIELIWGIGVGRWLCEGHKIDHPLLEKAVEIEIDKTDGSLLIRPRNIEPSLAINAYFALENPGIEALLRFSKKHFEELSEGVEFSPYIHESFEPVLRQASAQLSESGIYWSDINSNKENLEPPQISDVLHVTDSWLIYARPRSITSFIQDIERFLAKLEILETSELPQPIKRLVSELSNKKPLITGGGVATGGEGHISSSSHKPLSELYFPKPFNDAQVQIIERLEQSDGVVVQGPPGTGKTHTIANIVCHYLATGRSVLVTSKGEPALTEVQNHIPEKLRKLAISLLINERQGLKQLENAVELLSGIVSQTNLRDLKQQAESHELRVKQLERDINQIDAEIHAWGIRQLQPIDKDLSGTDIPMTAMELAQQVIADEGQHEWLPDDLGPSSDFKPQFSDSDIAEIREARRALGKDLVYVEKRIPVLQDLPDTTQIAAIHDDLVNSHKLSDNAQREKIPLLAVSVSDSVDRAKALSSPLNTLLSLVNKLEGAQWLKKIFNTWVETQAASETIGLFEELLPTLNDLVEQRTLFLRTHVEIPDHANNRQTINEALVKLSEGKKAFGLFSFGHKEAKALIDQVKIGGETPTTSEQWQLVRDYLAFQEDVRRFMVKWNHLGQELDLPPLSYKYGSLFKDLVTLGSDINEAKKMSGEVWPHIKKELIDLFPHGLHLELLLLDASEIEKALKAIELNTSRIMLGAQRQQLQSLIEKLNQCEGIITDQLKQTIEHVLGSAEYSTDKAIQKWQHLISELHRLHDLVPKLTTISLIAQKIADSGAKQWAVLLKNSPLLNGDDTLTPVHWYESWQWKRRAYYIRDIDGREHIKKLSERRSRLDKDLKNTFVELVRLKTYIGLHMNITERVQGALMRFVSAVKKIGKTGTGKRAPRHRRDAYKAMQDCYGGVPCWIMPTWRVSESLPSDFGLFDLVIIDEASQSDITALPAILRAKKLLIVGDDKQVSPTAAFLAEERILQLKHNFLRGQPFAQLLLPDVSTYDLANAVFPSQRIMLTEHFRCVEPIIRFSMQFYNEPLIPLRLPKASERLDPPLVDVYVPEGKRDERRKVNDFEIKAITEEIKAITADSKFTGRTIGVISLIGAQQAHEIQEHLLSELGEDIYQKFNITCGDSATFQGKERDIMFLSMVVGPGQGVAMSKREFEQRFNVALSRARDRMYLYRSIQESDLNNESDLRLKTIRHFANPMPRQQQVDDLVELCESDFERDVYNKLTKLGYNVTPQVKVGLFSIDLVVEGEKDRRLAIELDGDKYHPPEKWMEDWKRQRTMERVNWQFWRCWGSSYTLDPDGCIEDLVNTLNSLGIDPIGKSKRADIYTEHRVYKKDSERKSLSIRL